MLQVKQKRQQIEITASKKFFTTALDSQPSSQHIGLNSNMVNDLGYQEKTAMSIQVNVNQTSLLFTLNTLIVDFDHISGGCVPCFWQYLAIKTIFVKVIIKFL